MTHMIASIVIINTITTNYVFWAVLSTAATYCYYCYCNYNFYGFQISDMFARSVANHVI